MKGGQQLEWQVLVVASSILESEYTWTVKQRFNEARTATCMASTSSCQQYIGIMVYKTSENRSGLVLKTERFLV
jgi:hypothetical protein